MECATSRLRLLGLLAVAIALLGACYVCVSLHRGLVATVAGWVGLAFFGPLAIKFVMDMLRPGVRVIINDEGIEDHRLKTGVIPWDEITAIELRWMGSSKFLCVEVFDPEKYVARMPALARLAVRGEWAAGLSADHDDLRRLEPIN